METPGRSDLGPASVQQGHGGVRAMVRAAQPETKESQRADSPVQPNPRRDGVHAVLYDADGTDREADLEETRLADVGETQLLWIDVDTSREGALQRLAAAVELRADVLRDLESAQTGGRVRDYGAFFTVTVPAIGDRHTNRSAELHCVASRNWFVTAHHGTVPFIDEFDDHVRADSELGQLEAPSFLGGLLEWEMNDYFQAIEAVQNDVDQVEESILVDSAGEAALDRLVALRRRTAQLRRSLSAHRQVYATLSHPSFHALGESPAAQEFELLSERLDRAVQATESARDMAIGAFDLFMTRTAQRTNDIMKVLTTVSVLLLPATLLAGILGMNVLPHYLVQTWLFWVALGLMAFIGVGALWLLRRRGWL
jgi:magnesium transporter